MNMTATVPIAVKHRARTGQALMRRLAGRSGSAGWQGKTLEHPLISAQVGQKYPTLRPPSNLETPICDGFPQAAHVNLLDRVRIGMKEPMTASRQNTAVHKYQHFAFCAALVKGPFDSVQLHMRLLSQR
jgi:hypothetical protein